MSAVRPVGKGLMAAGFCVAWSGCAKVPLHPLPKDLVRLVPGMTYAEAQSVLGVDPYDVYLLDEQGQTVVVWNYTHPQVGTFAPSAPELYRAYAIFRDGRLSYLVTDPGREDFDELHAWRIAVRELEGCFDCVRGADTAHVLSESEDGGETEGRDRRAKRKKP